MNMYRLVVLFLLVGNIFVFFTMQNDFDENGRWALVGSALLLAIIWVYLGDSAPKEQPVRKASPVSNNVSSSQEDSLGIPEIVISDEMDGASLRERKMAKVAASKYVEEEDMVQIDPDDDLEEIAVTVEEVHVADEYVVEVSPQSI